MSMYHNLPFFKFSNELIKNSAVQRALTALFFTSLQFSLITTASTPKYPFNSRT